MWGSFVQLFFEYINLLISVKQWIWGTILSCGNNHMRLCHCSLFSLFLSAWSTIVIEFICFVCLIAFFPCSQMIISLTLSRTLVGGEGGNFYPWWYPILVVLWRLILYTVLLLLLIFFFVIGEKRVFPCPPKRAQETKMRKYQK